MMTPNRSDAEDRLLVLVPMALLAVASCGREELTEGEEGEYIHAGDAVYQVQLTRLLNPRQRRTIRWFADSRRFRLTSSSSPSS